MVWPNRDRNWYLIWFKYIENQSRLNHHSKKKNFVEPTNMWPIATTVNKMFKIKLKFELDFHLNPKLRQISTTSRVRNDSHKFIFRTYLRVSTYFFDPAPPQPFILFISLLQNCISLQLIHTYLVHLGIT